MSDLHAHLRRRDRPRRPHAARPHQPHRRPGPRPCSPSASSYNPANSVKDRIGVAIIDAAEAAGELRPGGTIVEATSGNTGIALAMVGAARGYKVVLTMPDTMSKERRALLRAFGAELVLTPGAQGMKGAVEQGERDRCRGQRRAGAPVRQRGQPADPPRHHRRRRSGTTRTARSTSWSPASARAARSSGAGKYLKERKPGVQIIAVEPAESPILYGGQPGPHKIQGIGANFVPDIVDRDVIDEVMTSTRQPRLSSRCNAATRGGPAGRHLRRRQPRRRCAAWLRGPSMRARPS